MVGDQSILLLNSGDAAAVAAGTHEDSSEVGGQENNSNQGGDRGYGGNRWPRQETLALLKIRSDMDATFRDSTLKGPLWEEVSRKLAALGYNRSAKKCKEKFENVYKYHRRTKEGRTGKPEGKTYRFFNQLEALENLHSLPSPSKSQSTLQPITASAQLPWPTTTTTTTIDNNSVPSLSHISVNPQSTNPKSTITPVPVPVTVPFHHHQNNVVAPLMANPITTITTPVAQASVNLYPVSTFMNVSSNLFSSSTSSSTASDEEFEERSSNRRKRKWKEFFKRLTKEVIHKQEELQKKFLDAVEKREQERMAREEAWRIQEMGRINREHAILVQERSTAAAKDAAVIAFLQKISSQQIPVQVPPNMIPNPNLNPNPSAMSPPQPPPQNQEHQQQQQQHYHHQQPPAAPVSLAPVANMEIVLSTGNGDNNINVINVAVPSPSRWPKAEVQALINLRTGLDTKYQDNGPKGPLWEEISAGMKRLGFNRNAKRCKEKWENINKYFKKVKESAKKRPEDSKTCPYFHQLDALYRKKNSNIINKNETATTGNITSGNYNSNNGNNIQAATPLMALPEQQWPLQIQEQQVQPQSMEDMERESAEHLHQIDHDDEDEEVGSDEEEGDDDEEGGGFELVANKSSSATSMAAGE